MLPTPAPISPPTGYRIGHCLDVLATVADGVFNCCVTSPPYWGLRDYGDPGQDWPAVDYAPMPGLAPVSVPAMTAPLGLEPAVEAFVAHMVLVFREVRRTLRDDGTLWLNLGDKVIDGQVLGIPWRVALALVADGWLLVSDVVWERTDATFDSSPSRPWRCHEQVFILAKSKGHHYDRDAIRADHAPKTLTTVGTGRRSGRQDNFGRVASGNWAGTERQIDPKGVPMRSVWSFAGSRFGGEHFATFPEELPRRAILSGCPEGGTVLDPFLGSGTTGMVAESLGRRWFGCEQSEGYEAIIKRRTAQAGLVFA